MTKGILTSIKTRNHLKSIWLKNHDEDSHNKYKIYRNKVTRLMEQAEQLFDHDDFSSCDGDSKKI